MLFRSIIEYPAMKRVREIGYSKYFFSGFLALALVSVGVFFFQEPIQLVVLTFIAGAAVSIVEPCGEAYFFRTVSKKEEENFYGPFATSGPVFYSATAFFFGILVGVLPFNTVFIAGAIMLTAFALVGATVKNV